MQNKLMVMTKFFTDKTGVVTELNSLQVELNVLVCTSISPVWYKFSYSQSISHQQQTYLFTSGAITLCITRRYFNRMPTAHCPTVRASKRTNLNIFGKRAPASGQTRPHLHSYFWPKYIPNLSKCFFFYL